MPGTISPIGVGTAAIYPRLTTGGTPLNMFQAPGDTNPPIVWEPPAALTGGLPEVWIVATGASPVWGGAQVWISSDGNTYQFLGNLYAGARQGVLTTPLPAGSDPDTTDTLAVDLSMSEGQLLSGTKADADGLVTLCYCDGELVAYETATLVSRYQYDLTYLRRGAYGTAVGGHAAGSQFARFGPSDASLFKHAYPASFVGRTLYVKLPAFNMYGQSQQGLAEIEPTVLSLTGAGIDLATNNAVIAALDAGITPEDWGIVGTPVVASADFAPIVLAAGLDIDLGTPL